MNKRILEILLSALLIANISACTTIPPKNTTDSVINEQYDTANTEKSSVESETVKHTADSVTSETCNTANTEEITEVSVLEMNESDATDGSIALKMYKEALYGFINKQIPNEFIDWRLSEFDDYLSLISFTILDMDGDNFPELVVKYLGEHAVLSYVSGQRDLYGGNLGLREMFGLHKDGSFCWTRRAGQEYGMAKYEKDRIVEIYRVFEDDNNDAEYFIGDQKVTEEELDTFIAQLCDELADFCALTEENIEKYVTLEIFNHE